MDVTGSSAIVTGGASGLGFATATRLAGAGARVVLVDLPGSPGAERAEELGGFATFVPADVTDGEQVQAAVEAAVARGPLRVVVNCAGIAPPAKVLGRDGPADLGAFERVLRVNVLGTFNVIRLTADAMQHNDPDGDPVDGAGDRGVIINTASVAAFDGQVGQPAYAASKGAVHSMTLPIARELARFGIRVVTIAPGIMETPMLAGLPEAAQESLGHQVPYPARLGRPDEYASLALHIVENGYLNGETIRLDGAIRMAPK
ncbi:SDR family NAD(P)-dependent oxidoreductase [Plantibacter cousiniae (nom. nud.)]|uniref:NAD(P)-dependent dehydrogenase, short-chain alcohol dehydrogenase family n=1 Tax=Plantibacter cousiniae (nom. nud.) TaxID=199709 RepID=A0ABY1LMV1_9MICO|nr:SDR family NAD(P)-dependent oxidoreductase [Plantibacter cousiniae]SKC66596.1 NAD(P)-dependent dehydrogenase, short-chain alcohol dehydrogenase family [Plantibacter cousiniae]